MDNDETTKPSANRKSLVIAPVAVVVLVAALLGGYAVGHNSATSPAGTSVSALAAQASATQHNNADVTFTQLMIPHHSQALDMAKLAATRASSQSVKDLALSIEAAQQPEIDKMNGWLTDWNAGAGATGTDSHSMSSGMMSESDMKSLEGMSGAQFDKAFLTMMTQHHTGAIAMARDEMTNGQNAQALALATSIQVTQQAEVNEMTALLQ